ncbi:MAG: purine phosphorylase [Thermodesulfobacteriota bacterium]
MTLLGVVTALKAEAQVLIKKPMATGEVLHLPEGILLKISGIGARRARVASETLVKKGATALLSWGSAGGLLATLSPGSLILPEKVLSSDRISFSVDTQWHERLCARLSGHADLHTGLLIQSPTVLRSPEEKIAMFNRYGAIAVDMESAAVAQVALLEGVPFMAIRAVSDPAYVSIPPSAMITIDERGIFRPVRLLRSIFRHPRELLPLVRLARTFRAAQTTLASVKRIAGPKLLAP